ncbi:type II CRISPR-associated endonuclease Cas1 [Sedimentisphaera salicampi]|uniref:type II CRISPR-associated endonuclease Cas1 n=1 Tax=Sedimentisphaera salicampi TaxID=1941349 RepID=UPI000B9BE818|nr:type II CRISPR-associated endonuclease Cas1 [Sedimentisphaera salicampi]OXU14956.1 CRISPR-associated endonuclease Cas1 [Sedimentisphaera salicampi]
MIKRIIEISESPCSLRIRNGQLIVGRNDLPEKQIPCEDVGVLLIDNQATTYTHSVLTRLLDFGAAVVLCNGEHHPAGMLLAIDSNSIQTERHRHQIEASLPLKKRLWKQLVQAKISHQAAVVKTENPRASKSIEQLAAKVRSGDKSNVEARASKLYWKYFLGSRNFKRLRGGAPPNNLLNYGYMILRAAVARAICSSGLLPSLGLHHCNRYNEYCLADDIMEPFRGFVEKEVRLMWRENPDEEYFAKLSQLHKARLLETLHKSVTIAQSSGPLMVGLHKTAASLYKCFAGEEDSLELPDF